MPTLTASKTRTIICQRMRRERSFGAQWTEVGSQHPAYIRLGYPKLPRDPRRFDSRLKCCTNGIDLPTSQRDSHFRLPSMGRFVRWRRTLRGLIAWWQYAAPLYFLEDCRAEVLRQRISLQGRVGSWLCHRNGICCRWRPVSDYLGREQVRCPLFSTISSHGGGSCPHRC